MSEPVGEPADPSHPAAHPPARPAVRAPRPLPLLAALAWMAVAAAGTMLTLALVWPDDLSEHRGPRLALDYIAFMGATFLFHAGVGMAVVVPFALLTRRRRLAIAALAIALTAAGPEAFTAARAGLREPGPPSIDPDALTLMSANLLYGRTDPQRLLAEIRRHRPDVIVFQEWTPRSAAAVKPLLLADYPHWVDVPRDDAFGQAVCSKRPFTRPPRPYLPSILSDPQITVTVDLGGRDLRITDVHVLPPVNLSYFAEQREAVCALAHHADVNGTADPITDVLVGDFNAVPRSPVLRRLRAAGLVEAHGRGRRGASAGRWRGTTWPRTGALRWAPGIRLDHVLHAPALVCDYAAVCADVGSDHAPIVARFKWASD